MSEARVDRLYRQTTGMAERFCFDAQVTAVFADMIRRSVPGYGLTLEMIAIIAERYASAGSTVYDLGCSLGASTLAIRHAVEGRDCHIIGLDNATAMVEQCRELVARDQASSCVTIQCADVCAVDFQPASMMVMNFTLQFIPVAQRLPLLQSMAQALAEDGVLVLSEKITFDDDWEAETQQALHEAFKAAQGYSELEISRKRQALEDVLLPETIAQHRQRLLDAGFARVTVWFQCANFISLLAFRGQA